MGGWEMENEVFSLFVFYAGVLCLKMLVMAPITGYYRITKKVFANPEDAAMFKKEVSKGDEDVERVRRAHQNDLENIPLFFMIGLLYVLSDPSVWVARMCFRVYTMSRILHSFMYLRKSSYRGMAFAIGISIIVYMTITVVWTFW